MGLVDLKTVFQQHTVEHVLASLLSKVDAYITAPTAMRAAVTPANNATAFALRKRIKNQKHF